MNAIDCTAARELMLEAEVAELKGEATTPLAQHLQTCEHCRAAAAHLVRSYDRLDLGLRGLAAPRKKRWRRWAAAPLAAAAVLALLLSQRTEELPPENTKLIALMFRDEPVVTPPAGKQAVVVDNNDLTVVWFY